MSTTLQPERSRASRDAVLALARTEARRALLGFPFWIGIALTAFFVYNTLGSGNDWQSATYQGFFIDFGPLAAGIFVAGVLAGGRDRRPDDDGLAAEAALDANARAGARLLGLVPLVMVGALLVVGAAIGIRIEGGNWIGDAPGRVDDAVHGPFEVLAPILFFALAAATGVALGRVVTRRAPVIVIGIVVCFMLTVGYWMLQWSPALYVNPVQIQPIELEINGAGAHDPNAVPDGWLLVDPEGEGEWRRVTVHTPLVAWHDVYLVGLVLVAIGAAVRGRRGRTTLLVGAAIVIAGIAGQVVATPDGFVGMGD